jgi:L-ascorbate metabolism protein UlaG (beta-lactamase superfamily)
VNTPLYLRQDIQFEPLVDQWYAWSQLIPPCTAARNMTERHFQIMDSYVSAPQVHANAVKNPKMLGGPFIDYGGKRVSEIQALKAKTKSVRSDSVELSSSLAALDATLRSTAKGLSLQPVFQNVPECLRGYVELGYDVNNNPSFRILEPLVYRSPLYNTVSQSLMLSVTSGDDRPFVLSTPRLEGPNLLHLPWHFEDGRVDELFRLKTIPQTWRDIQDRLGLNAQQAELFRTFLTEAPPRPYEKYTGAGVRWRYFGHACILIETKNTSMLFDPVLSYTYESKISRYTYADLPPAIDFVLITHNHQDHILFETMLQLRDRVKTIIVPKSGPGAIQDPSLKLALEHTGFRNVVELGELESIEFEKDCSITGLPFFGEHADMAITTKLAYRICIGRESLLFAADSCNVEPLLYRHLHRVFGDISALFLGMECDGAPLSWLYGPLLFQRPDRAADMSRRLAGSNFEQAIAIVDEFRCKDVYVYAMGQEPWLNYVMSLKYTEESRPIVESNRLIETCRQRGICSERLFGEKEILLEDAFAFAGQA